MKVNRYKKQLLIHALGLFGFSIVTIFSHTFNEGYKIYIDSMVFAFYFMAGYFLSKIETKFLNKNSFILFALIPLSISIAVLVDFLIYNFDRNLFVFEIIIYIFLLPLFVALGFIFGKKWKVNK